MVRECGLTFEEVKQLNLYEKRLLLGYTPRKGPERDTTRSDTPATQRKRPRSGMKKRDG